MRAMTVTPSVPPIPTPRFELVSMSLDFLRLLQAGDLPAASAEIGGQVPEDFGDGLDVFLRLRIADLTHDPDTQPWLGRAIVMATPDERTVIGSIGFHAPPDPDGWVEIGYSVVPAARRQGVATECGRALIDWAIREHGVTRFRATTDPENAISQRVLQRLGFRLVETRLDDRDTLEFVFERVVPTASA